MKRNIRVWLLVSLMIPLACTVTNFEIEEIPDDTPTPQVVTVVEEEPDSPLDCIDDMECFIQAVEACQPSNVLFVFPLDMGGILVSTTTEMAIEGSEEGQCVFRVKTATVEISYSEEAIQQMKDNGMSDADIDAQSQMFEEQNLQAGYDDVCRGSTDDLAVMLTNWKNGSFSLDDWDPFTCEGKVFSQESSEPLVVESTEIPPTSNLTEVPISISSFSIAFNFDSAGFLPQSLAYDGFFMWVGGMNRDLVVKTDLVSSVQEVTKFPKLGAGVPDMAFDGIYLWALVQDKVAQVQVSDGAKLGYLYPEVDEYGFLLESIVYDGRNVWLGGADRDLLVKVDTSSGETLAVLALAKTGLGVPDLVFDGTYVWAVVSNTLYQVRAQDAVVVRTYFYDFDETFFIPQSLAYDGVRIWAGGSQRDLVVAFNPSSRNMQVVQFSNSGAGVPALLFDGTDLWALSATQLYQIEIVNGVIMSSMTVEAGGIALGYDGTDIWIAYPGMGTIYKP
jgi:hypothetical protein